MPLALKGASNAVCEQPALSPPTPSHKSLALLLSQHHTATIPIYRAIRHGWSRAGSPEHPRRMHNGRHGQSHAWMGGTDPNEAVDELHKTTFLQCSAALPVSPGTQSLLAMGPWASTSSSLHFLYIRGHTSQQTPFFPPPGSRLGFLLLEA